MRVRVKICGVTGVEDAVLAAEAGADAIGLVFAESPRKVTLDNARRIISFLPPFVCAVGVFVDAPRDEVLGTAGAVGLHAVQLHGNESPEYAASLGGLGVIKSVRVASPEDVLRAELYRTAVLFDTASERFAGGSGETFPWEYVAGAALERPVILAGGLTPESVARALSVVRAWGVDVSSGVESGKGVKDPRKIRLFIENVRRFCHADG